MLGGETSIWSLGSVQHNSIRIAQCENIRAIECCKQESALERKDKKQAKATEGDEVSKRTLRKVRCEVCLISAFESHTRIWMPLSYDADDYSSCCYQHI